MHIQRHREIDHIAHCDILETREGYYQRLLVCIHQGH